MQKAKTDTEKIEVAEGISNSCTLSDTVHTWQCCPFQRLYNLTKTTVFFSAYNLFGMFTYTLKKLVFLNSVQICES